MTARKFTDPRDLLEGLAADIVCELAHEHEQARLRHREECDQETCEICKWWDAWLAVGDPLPEIREV